MPLIIIQFLPFIFFLSLFSFIQCRNITCPENDFHCSYQGKGNDTYICNNNHGNCDCGYSDICICQNYGSCSCAYSTICYCNNYGNCCTSNVDQTFTIFNLSNNIQYESSGQCPNESSKLIVGIIIGLIGFFLIGLLGYCCVLRYRKWKKKKRSPTLQPQPLPHQPQHQPIPSSSLNSFTDIPYTESIEEHTLQFTPQQQPQQPPQPLQLLQPQEMILRNKESPSSKDSYHRVEKFPPDEKIQGSKTPSNSNNSNNGSAIISLHHEDNDDDDNFDYSNNTDTEEKHDKIIIDPSPLRNSKSEIFPHASRPPTPTSLPGQLVNGRHRSIDIDSSGQLYSRSKELDTLDFNFTLNSN